MQDCLINKNDFKFAGEFINKHLTKNLILIFSSNPKELYYENSSDYFIKNYLKITDIENNYNENTL